MKLNISQKLYAKFRNRMSDACGLQNSEFKNILDLLTDMDAHAILEIGTGDWDVTRAIDSVLKDGYILSMDTIKPKKPDLRNKWTFVQFDSLDKRAPAAVSSLIGTWPVDFLFDALFINGNPFFNYPLQNFRRYHRYVRNGGAVIWCGTKSWNIRRCYDAAIKEMAWPHAEISDHYGPGYGVMFIP